MKLRYFYKIDQNKKEPIAGSNIRRKSPPPGKLWREILDPCCAVITPFYKTDGPRYYVQLDSMGKPVDGSLIKRYHYPESVPEVRFQEINWASVCRPSCATPPNPKFFYEFQQNYVSGWFKLYVNNVLTFDTSVDDTFPSTGNIPAKSGDVIKVQVHNNLDGFCLETGATINLYTTDATGSTNNTVIVGGGNVPDYELIFTYNASTSLYQKVLIEVHCYGS